MVIEAFDRLLEQKSPEAFAIVVLDNASMYRSASFQRKELAGALCDFPARILARAQPDWGPLAEARNI